MWITENIEIKFNNPSDEFTVGLHFQAGDGYPVDEETNETKFDEEPISVYRLSIGFLLFNINITW